MSGGGEQKSYSDPTLSVNPPTHIEGFTSANLHTIYGAAHPNRPEYPLLRTCGVVTTTAPSTPAASFKYCTIEMCSSDVPGGVSMMR